MVQLLKIVYGDQDITFNFIRKFYNEPNIMSAMKVGQLRCVGHLFRM
jgi:hypothetical protein